MILGIESFKARLFRLRLIIILYQTIFKKGEKHTKEICEEASISFKAKTKNKIVIKTLLISQASNYFDSLPVVRRFLCPPEMPLSISSPTLVSAQFSSPSTCVVGGRKKSD